MVVQIHGDETTPAYEAARDLVEKLGHTVTDGSHFVVDIAIAPLLTRILSPEALDAPKFGTLIFHPSPLPYGRGASAIKYAYKRHEPITAATWFWANEGVDSGDICEQEILRVDYSLRPRDFYSRDIIPAMLRTLERALGNVEKGYIRRVPQIEKYATYDKKL